MLLELFILSQILVSDSQHLDMDMDASKLHFLSKIMENFHDLAESHTWTCIHVQH